MKKKFTTLLACFAALIINYTVNAQSVVKQPSVFVSGEVTKSLNINLADLARYPQTQVVRKDHDGKDHSYTGVVLSLILQDAGATMGKDLRGKNLAKCIKVTAADNYQVVFALAELDKDFTDRTIILASKVDGQPLPAGEGFFRIIVENEKKPARCIRQVTGIEVLTVK